MFRFDDVRVHALALRECTSEQLKKPMPKLSQRLVSIIVAILFLLLIGSALVEYFACSGRHKSAYTNIGNATLRPSPSMMSSKKTLVPTSSPTQQTTQPTVSPTLQPTKAPSITRPTPSTGFGVSLPVVSTDAPVSPTLPISVPSTCSSMASLCNKTVDSVLFATLHNAGAAEEKGFVLPNHPSSALALEAGFRGLNCDIGKSDDELGLVGLSVLPILQ